MLKSQKTLGCLIVIIVILVNVNLANANRMIPGRFNNIIYRKVQLKNRTYNLIVDNYYKTITVEGEVYDYKEMNEVENLFRKIIPFGYELICRLDFSNIKPAQLRNFGGHRRYVR